MDAICRFIRDHANDGTDLSLSALAKLSSLSPHHFQRTFKAATGLTPRQYAEASRLESLKSQLRDGQPVTTAIYQAGFNSSSRVYERAGTRLGMTPAQYRKGGAGLDVSYVTVQTPLGPLMLGATDRGLCFVQFGDDLLTQLRREYPAAALHEMTRPYPEQFGLWADALARHLHGDLAALDLPLDLQATAFQMKVWRYLQTIPSGDVQSYSEVAAGIGQPTAARAVARACASNRVAIVIPCHRVIRGNGDLGGYRWGRERKRTLIDRERAARYAILAAAA